jgi:hypothetical protein
VTERFDAEKFDHCLDCGWSDHECDVEKPQSRKCPECDGEWLWEDECSNLDCEACGSLVDHCLDCGWTDDPCEALADYCG